jgi:UrcA family protein
MTPSPPIFRSIATTSFIAVPPVVVASPATADPRPQRSLAPAVTVRFGNLNTSTPRGAAVLYARIADAAQAVCDSGALWYPTAYWASKECYQTTVDKVVARLNLLALGAHFAATHGGLRRVSQRIEGSQMRADTVQTSSSLPTSKP